MKKILIGFIAGALFATTGTVMADSEFFNKVTATVRSDYTFEVEGEKVSVGRAPLVYNGASYVPLRELARIMDKKVDFYDGVIRIYTALDDADAELERLRNNVQLANTNLEKMQKIISEADAGLRDLTYEERAVIENAIVDYQDAIDFNERMIEKLLKQIPDLAE
ncbi:ELKS/Rab6-interacting/CAST family protein [Paenibacillus soyae]|uniref:ELKS/Rab6-interacting/CAST family protein n=1 Tax=Paenibacillus soyae TaxID=2969249 RepID=A0A9X2MV42_9BACL|nr:ELKS/Rab6-interacting/CAST family protein [Paenibacillus soyae]MCR2806849.1 ELKS/Rab6-interacting/CAST family protein [Paenibacillus soyae]